MTNSVYSTSLKDSLRREMMIREGASQLRSLMASNERNNANGTPEKNQYLLTFDGGGNYIEQLNAASNSLIYGLPILTNDQQIKVNESLVNINKADGNGNQFGVYVLVFNSWFINLTKEIPEDAKIDDLYDLKPYTNENLKQRVWDEIKDLGNQIFERAGFGEADFKNRVGVVLGREILLLEKKEFKAYMTGEAYSKGLNEIDLAKVNASIASKKISMGDPFDYLKRYPALLYEAFKSKTAPPIKLENQFKPTVKSYFGQLASKATAGNPGDEMPPSQDVNRALFDYSGGLSLAEKQDILSQLQTAQQRNKCKSRIFITSWKTAPHLLNYASSYLASPTGPMEIALWVHFGEDGSVSYKSGYSKDVPLQEESKKYLSLLASILPDLPELKFNPLVAMFDGLTGLIEELKVPPRFYDPADQDYNPLPGRVFNYVTLGLLDDVVKPATSWIPFGSYSEQQFGQGRMGFAFWCGAWNGSVELVASGAKLLSLMTDPDKLIALKDAGVNLIKKWYSYDGINGMPKGIVISIEGFFKGLYESHSGNPCFIAEKLGEDALNIFTLAIAFVKVGKLASLAEALEAIDPLSHIIKFGGKFVKYAYTVTRGVSRASLGIYHLAENGLARVILNAEHHLEIVVRRSNEEVWQAINWVVEPSYAVQLSDGNWYRMRESAYRRYMDETRPWKIEFADVEAANGDKMGIISNADGTKENLEVFGKAEQSGDHAPVTDHGGNGGHDGGNGDGPGGNDGGNGHEEGGGVPNGPTGIFKKFTQAQLADMEPVINDLVKNIKAEKIEQIFLDPAHIDEAMAKLRDATFYNQGDIVELPARDHFVRNLLPQENAMMGADVIFRDANGQKVGGRILEVDAVILNSEAKRIDRSVTIKFDKGYFSKGRTKDKKALTHMAKLPEKVDELRDYMVKNLGWPQKLCDRIEKAEIKYLDARSNTEKFMSMQEFQEYIGKDTDFSKFKIDGLSPEDLGVTQDELLQGVVELVRRKLRK
ncbi:MAG: hypothetical protein JO154_26455 [Chitinophaga sp.]|uniref:hypothetical protein n=1 Tax=Chitinophaga sp. TaxID=1869181 RepID=UPI0025BE1D11|nr:hypothetical protein [Chitinophaga sp.]MBV8256164.1 hypothetical protein [Chitinophaga sp.]